MQEPTRQTLSVRYASKVLVTTYNVDLAQQAAKEDAIPALPIQQFAICNNYS